MPHSPLASIAGAANTVELNRMAATGTQNLKGRAMIVQLRECSYEPERAGAVSLEEDCTEGGRRLI